MAEFYTKHKSRPRKKPARRTGAKRQARLAAPWFALANEAENQLADLLGLAKNCLNPEEIANLETLPRKQAKKTIRDMAVLVREFLEFLEEIAQYKRAGERVADADGAY